ncbi:2-oxoacid:acceptor oxidoreductase family protein [Dethiobacter alkaliphilus]|uniref:2-oxoacid:acceptor oxidoreductase family protein n=1 Tax=Dethiobacter alkaliphilus TaxID=427926 RepID=UPI002226A0EA|nr:2-oxoacid:acceptor oxidoreductase family protein [Dethiobacter alkaliphilus]MCW3489689.1 2-oxoacid:acceptor oxidoreductase family protein [Dethiobacter alkaliphilus]
MNNRREYRLCGTGGQGLILASIILAEAAAQNGMQVVQTQSYGPEARGGASKSEVIVAPDRIDHPKVIQPHTVLIMSSKAYAKYGADYHPQGTVILDSTFVTDAENKYAFKLPITRHARTELGTEIVANIVALGVINTLSEEVPHNLLQEAVLNRAPKGTEVINTKALELGMRLAQTLTR